jgi:hypothetical protein
VIVIYFKDFILSFETLKTLGHLEIGYNDGSVNMLDAEINCRYVNWIKLAQGKV